MDDLAHELPLNHRKRKAGNDDHATSESQDTRARAASDGLLVDTSTAANSRQSVITPRLPWLAGGNTIWPSPSSPSSCSPVSPESEYNSFSANPPKRQRLDALDLPPSKPTEVPCKIPRAQVLDASAIDGNEDCAGRPVPSSSNHLFFTPITEATLPACIDYSPPHTPPLKPPISRHTLQELELDSIIHNPQLRHDLLVEPRLQFRPTHSRRKRDAAEKYWAALLQELQDGCTCFTFDADGKPRSRICACAFLPSDAATPIVAFLPVFNAYTVRTPSRIRPFLCEFLEVLQLVIQPLSDLSSLITDGGSMKENVQKHSTQATYIRSIFDPSLIEQEIERNLFDPTGLLESVGCMLKDHCAPMRDSAVDEMIQTARNCATGGKTIITEALRAFRMCMELFEIMKLDIANHQLQSLRPHLARTSGQYELETFRSKMGLDGGLQRTQTWLRKARSTVLAQQRAKPHRSRPPEILLYSELSTNQQVHLAALMGLVDLVFTPPIDLVNEATSSPRSDRPPAAAYPETLYLDTKRLTALSFEAADLMSLYLSLLLYRQLAQAKSPTDSDVRTPSGSCLQRLKEELRAIAGTRLVYCFLHKDSTGRQDTPDKRADRWISLREDITIQIVKHAHRSHERVSSTGDQTGCGDTPDGQLLSLARNWIGTNFHPDSELSALARDRLRNVVLDAVIRTMSPRRSTGARKSMEIHVRPADDLVARDASTEPLMDEVCMLAHKITRLASVHLGTYLPLYEQESFLNT